MGYQKEYSEFKKPPLSPPPYLFGIVWPFLYILIIISYGFVFYQAYLGNISWSVTIPFAINLVANAVFTYLQFRLKNNFLALLDIVVVLTTIIITMTAAWPLFRWVTYLQIPYLIWVGFATYLQAGVTILNRVGGRNSLKL